MNDHAERLVSGKLVVIGFALLAAALIGSVAMVWFVLDPGIGRGEWRIVRPTSLTPDD